jgi:hypothetical protein
MNENYSINGEHGLGERAGSAESFQLKMKMHSQAVKRNIETGRSEFKLPGWKAKVRRHKRIMNHESNVQYT